MKHALLAIMLQLAASGADAWTTHAQLTTRGKFERNPIARPFMGSTAGQVAYFGGQAGLKIVLPLTLRRHGHRRLAIAAESYGILDNAVSVGNNVKELGR